MAWLKCLKKSSLSNYIYKNGVVNPNLGGGLSRDGYSRGANNVGTVTFESTYIRFSNSYLQGNTILGTVDKVDLTNFSKVKVKYKAGGTEYNSELNVSNISGSRYIFITLSGYYDAGSGTIAMYSILGIATSKTIPTSEPYVFLSGSANLVMDFYEIELE